MRPCAAVRFEIPTPILRWPESDVLGARLISLTQDRECKKLILDFGRVEFVSATALGKLLAVRQELLSRGKRLVFRNLQPQVYEVLLLTGLAEVFEVRGPVAGLLECRQP